MEAEWHIVQPNSETPSTDLTVRNAQPSDAGAVAAVLAQAFPSLYRGTFGSREPPGIVSLLHSLYEYGHLSLADTRVCVAEERVVAVMILHTGLPIGRGSVVGLWRLLYKRFGLLWAPRVYCGAIMANLMLNRRIPRAPDLVYIEALAVEESHRSRGIGSLLLADAEAWARSRGRSRLALHVLANNAGARRLYKRAGFHPWHSQGPRSRWQSLGRASLPPSSWSAILMTRRLEG